MGQKVNPVGLRVALHKNWASKWFAKRSQFGEWLLEDVKIRDFIKANYNNAAIARIVIERFASRIRITILAARPGQLHSKKGEALEEMRKSLDKIAKNKEILIQVEEVRRPETNAQLVAENVAMQLERRIGFRRAMKKSIQTAMDQGAEGIKIAVAGRLGGAELARSEQYKEGRTPLHTLKANIDYGFTEANTVAGKIGVKVWICQKELTEEQQNAINAKKSKVQKDTARQ